MPKKEATDGGHTVFTDHRIQERPEYGSTVAATIIAPWRQPPEDLATRNLGIASIQIGMEQRSGSQILNGYRMLTEIQEKFPQDSEIYTWMGSALFVGRQYGEAVKAFDLAVRLDPKSSPKEASLGQAYAVLGQVQLAEQHFEKVMKLDPLNLAAAAILINIYDKNGQTVEPMRYPSELHYLFIRKQSVSSPHISIIFLTLIGVPVSARSSWCLADSMLIP